MGYFYEEEHEFSVRKFLYNSFFFFFFKKFEDIKAVAFACVFYDKFLLMPHLVWPIYTGGNNIWNFPFQDQWDKPSVPILSFTVAVENATGRK